MINVIYVEDLRDKPSLTNEMKSLITSTVTATLEYEQIDKPCFVSVSVVEPDEIQALNKENRGVDSVTDVLSFPVVNLLDGSDCSDAGDYCEGRLILGDVVICADRAKEQSEEFGHSIEREMGYLTCHSVLHLIGYDHEDESEREIMRVKEEAVMDKMNLKR